YRKELFSISGSGRHRQGGASAGPPTCPFVILRSAETLYRTQPCRHAGSAASWGMDIALPDLTFDPALKEWTLGLFEALRRMSFDGVGISRATYGEGESGAIALVAEAARREGLQVAHDAAANLVVTLPGRRPELPF